MKTGTPGSAIESSRRVRLGNSYHVHATIPLSLSSRTGYGMPSSSASWSRPPTRSRRRITTPRQEWAKGQGQRVGTADDTENAPDLSIPRNPIGACVSVSDREGGRLQLHTMPDVSAVATDAGHDGELGDRETDSGERTWVTWRLTELGRTEGESIIKSLKQPETFNLGGEQ